MWVVLHSGNRWWISNFAKFERMFPPFKTTERCQNKGNIHIFLHSYLRVENQFLLG